MLRILLCIPSAVSGIIFPFISIHKNLRGLIESITVNSLPAFFLHLILLWSNVVKTFTIHLCLSSSTRHSELTPTQNKSLMCTVIDFISQASVKQHIIYKCTAFDHVNHLADPLSSSVLKWSAFTLRVQELDVINVRTHLKQRIFQLHQPFSLSIPK